MSVVVPIISTFDSKGIQRALADFKKLDGGANKAGYALRTMDRAATNMAKSLAKIGAGAAVFGGMAVKSFVDFDAAMNESLAIMGNVSEGMRTEMSAAARKMSKETTFSATQAAESFYFLASAGLDAEQSIAALPKVGKFAQAGMFDMALATTLLADAQSALGLRSADAEQNLSNLTRVSDVLVKANILANASVQQFSEALTNKAGASMRSLNIDIEEGVAVLAAFAAVGVKGSEAGTMFNATIRGLTNGVARFPEVFKKFNIQVFDSSGAMNNLADIVAQMERAFKGMSVEQKRASLTQLGFTEETLAGALALIGNSEAIRGYERDLRNASGTTEEVANNQLKSLSAQLTLAKNAFVDLAISLGERMAPAIEAITRVMQTFAGIVGEQGVGAGVNYLSGQIVGAVGKMGLFGKAVVGMVAAFAALRVATVTYTATMGALNIITQVSDGALKALIIRLGAARIAMLAAGGVVALLSAAAVVYGVYAKRKSDAIQATKNFRDALDLEGEAQEEALLALYKSDKNYKMHIDTLKTMNITLGETNQFIQSGTGPLTRLVNEWNKADASAKGIYPKLQAYAEALGISTEKGYGQVAMVRNLVEEMVRQRKETLDNARAQANLALAMGDSAKASLIMQQALGMDPSIKKNAKEATDDLTKAQEELDKILKDLGSGGGSVKSVQDKVDKAKEAFRNFKSQAESVFSQQKSLKDATKSTADAYDDLSKATNTVITAQAKLNQIVKGYGAGSTEASEAQKELTLAEREAERAGYALETANFAVIDAQTKLTEARAAGDPRAIREAEIALAEALLSVKDAEDAVTASKDAVTEAQTRLNEVTNGATTESIAYKEALAELTTAQDAEVEALNRVNDAKIREFEITKKLAQAELALAKIKKTLTKKQLKQARKVLNDLGAMPSDLLTTAPSQSAIPSIDLSGLNLGGLFDFNFGSIPMLASGGIAIRPTLAMIGESGPEAVVPLDRGLGGDVYHIQINSKIADETLPDLLVAELRKFNRRSGAINIQVA